jgi:hypothetical protein
VGGTTQDLQQELDLLLKEGHMLVEGGSIVSHTDRVEDLTDSRAGECAYTRQSSARQRQDKAVPIYAMKIKAS